MPMATKNSLDNFVWEEHALHVPIALHTKLADIFAKRAYGWKVRAKLVQKLSESYSDAEKYAAQLTALCNLESRKALPEDEARKGLRKWLNMCDEAQLITACDKHSVSYASYASDRQGMIDAIIEEIVRVQ